MRCTQFYPVIMTDDVEGTAAFYCAAFRFERAFCSDWYAHLRSSEAPEVNLAVMRGDHDSIPAEGRGRTQSLLINFEVEDVDAEYERARANALPILLTLRDEAVGQRHFITKDPNGVLIDVIKVIPPSPEFAAHYAENPLPRA